MRRYQVYGKIDETTSDHNLLCTRKIYLFGEHVVVYGKRAIAFW